MLCLTVATDARWAPAAVSNLPVLLADHAQLRGGRPRRTPRSRSRRAGALSLTPASLPRRACLDRDRRGRARLTLREVLGELERRGLPLGKPDVDDYVAELRAVVERRPAKTARGKVVDRLLVGALIEARSCERFRLLADELGARGDALAAFYERLFADEARHYTTLVDLAEHAADEPSDGARAPRRARCGRRRDRRRAPGARDDPRLTMIALDLLDREIANAATLARVEPSVDTPKTRPRSSAIIAASRSVHVELGEMPATPLGDGARAWVAALTLDRVLWPDRVRVAATRAAAEVLVTGIGVDHKVSIDHGLIRLLEDTEVTRRRLVARAMANGADAARGAARILAERRAEAARQLGVDLDELEIPVEPRPALAAAAERVLVVTAPFVPGAVEAWSDAIDPLLARDAGEGWPAHLTPRWLLSVFERSALFDGLRLAPPSLPRLFGARPRSRARSPASAAPTPMRSRRPVRRSASRTRRSTFTAPGARRSSAASPRSQRSSRARSTSARRGRATRLAASPARSPSSFASTPRGSSSAARSRRCRRPPRTAGRKSPSKQSEAASPGSLPASYRCSTQATPRASPARSSPRPIDASSLNAPTRTGSGARMPLACSAKRTKVARADAPRSRRGPRARHRRQRSSRR